MTISNLITKSGLLKLTEAEFSYLPKFLDASDI